MFTYVFGLNVLVCCAASWTAVLYAAFTRDWVGTALWATLAFAAVNAKRLTPRHEEPEG